MEVLTVHPRRELRDTSVGVLGSAVAFSTIDTERHRCTAPKDIASTDHVLYRYVDMSIFMVI